MKLSIEDFERSGQVDPLVLFSQGIKAELTRKKYTRTLRQVLCGMLEDILQGTFEERAAQLVKYGRDDPGWVRDLLLSLSRKLRERTLLPPDHPQYLNPVSFGGYFKPVKKLLDMNDVTMQWKRIYATFPEEDSPSVSRGWNRAEVGRMLRFCRGPLERSIILVCASSGIRAGEFSGLEWRDLAAVYRTPGGRLWMYDRGAGARGGGGDSDGNELPPEGSELACAKLQVYRGSPESYPAFITPEAYSALLDYREEWAARVGRDPRPGDPMFIKAGCLPRRAALPVITKRVRTVITRAGLRQPQDSAAAGGGRARRHEVPMMNGFRRFWNKTCKESLSRESPLAALIKKEYMMGHAGLVKLDRNYFKAHVLELAEEYVLSVPALTMGDAERLRLENARQAEAMERMRDEKDAEIAGLRRAVEELARMMELLPEGGGGKDKGGGIEQGQSGFRRHPRRRRRPYEGPSTGGSPRASP